MTLLPMPFGNPSTYPAHSGVDFAQRAGSSIRASAPGVVVSQGYTPVSVSNPRAAGHWMTVQYDGGPRVFMCHFLNRASCPRNGDRFGYGDHLAPVGSTGFSTGPHLHLAIDGQPGYANVWRYFDRNRVVGDGSSAGGGGNVVIPPKKRVKSNMATLFFNTDKATFALAGDGEGQAAWLEFTDQHLANNLAAFHGISQQAVPLGDVSFREWRAKYLGV